MPKHKKAEKLDTEEAESTENNTEQQSANAKNLTSSETTTPTNTDIMEAITKLNGSFDTKLEVLSSTLSEMKEALTNIGTRVAATEEAVKVHETRIESLEKLCTLLEAECEKLKEKTCDLESRSRRQNIRIVGVKEGAEKGKPTEFVTNLLTQVLDAGNFDRPIQIDRAHRLLQPPREGRSRAFIVRLHHYQVKEHILRLARSNKLQYEGKEIHIFPDLAADVLKQRQKFDAIRKKCREH
ncbi:LINE-1 retrotransposable element ORF1 protein [Anabarilius grahami]|uniref:LINE-1 retrotransposable element ORF1 protein n=1 Tax=Anabarilius grahami TaxID=495550 RepID=A0A3N0XUB0_ANAGA|nr:LINE-1 retrotransposable element ORF1 protein [Anabarilius grahami]